MKQKKLNLSAVVFMFIISFTTVFSQTPPIPDTFSPTFSHLSGRYNSDIEVKLTTRTPEAKIFYTIDGTKPDSTSQKYTDKILIAGDGNYKTIKAITISGDTAISLISSSTYIIDYSFNPNASYLTNLSWEEYNDFIQGDWFGYTSNPWTNNYSVNLSILPNGNYIDQTTTGCDSYPYNDVFQTVFYYGVSNPSLLKTIELYNILPSGFANGYINIDFGVSTNTDELRYIKFIDNRNLYLEMWHSNQYGPLKYYLTKNSEKITSSIELFNDTKPLVFPNPASDYIIIKNLNSDIQLTNIYGQSFMLNKSETISVSNLPRGLYILVYQNNEGIKIQQKVILK